MKWWLLACVMMMLAGCSERAAAPAAPVNHLRYYDGQSWVTVRVLLDRLHVERGTTERITAREAYLLRTPVGSLAELEEVARQMRAAQPDIRSVSVFIDEPASNGVRRGRLTRQVLIRGRMGVDLARIAANHGTRSVRQVDGRADTLIAESASQDLFAAFVLASAVYASGGVIAAIPLTE